MSEIKVLPIIPHPDDATSFYRGQLPITSLAHHYKLGLIYSERLSWSTMSLTDVLFLQRPFIAGQHLAAAQLAQKLCKPVWCDWDDDLFSVPEDNPAHSVYSDKGIQEAIATLAAMADVVSVSTRALKDRFDEIRKRAEKPGCIVIPNALSDHFLELRPEPVKEGRRKMIFWRGSNTHMYDLMSVTEPLINTMHQRPDWTIHFLGFNPAWMTRAFSPKQCIVGAGMDILDYHTYFGQIQPGITIVPLDDSEFTRAKSNIAWIEATWARSQVIAPRFPEWERPGILNYSTHEEFQECLRTAMSEVEMNDTTRIDASWDFITNFLLLSKTNTLRWDLLKYMCPKKAHNLGEILNETQFNHADPSSVCGIRPVGILGSRQRYETDSQSIEEKAPQTDLQIEKI